MSGQQQGGGGIILAVLGDPSTKATITKADGQKIVDLLNVAGETTLAAVIQPIVNGAS